MVKNDKNGMTINDLAIMVAKGFESVDKKFESIEERMVTKEDLQKMATKEDLQKMATKEDIKRLEQKVGRLDTRVEEIHDIVTVLAEGEIPDLQRRVTVLERTVKVSR